MAKRKGRKFNRVDSAEVQGEGSFVIIQSPGFDALGNLTALADLLALIKLSEDGDPKDIDLTQISPEAFGGMLSLLEAVVMEWDWVNDEGEPLPNPKDDPQVIRRELTQDEQAFLIANIDFGGTDPKN